MKSLKCVYLFLLAFWACFGCDEGIEIVDDILIREPDQSPLTAPLPTTHRSLPEHDDIPLKLMSPEAIEREYGPGWMHAPVPATIPQQHIDRQSGIMWVGHGFLPHENGTVFVPKVTEVFLTAEAALRSEQYQMLKNYFAEWNAEYDKIAHTTDEWLFPEHYDFDGNSVYVHFNIATKREVRKFLTSAVRSGEFHKRSIIIKNTVETEGIVRSEHLFPSFTLFALALSEWEHLIFPAAPHNSITWFQVRVFAKNTEELGSDEEYAYHLNLTDDIPSEPIPEEPKLTTSTITIGSFGFGNAEDVLQDEDVINYLGYVKNWAEAYCSGVKNPLHVMLFDFPNNAEAKTFQRLLRDKLHVRDEDITISDYTVYLNPTDPCEFQIDISP